MNIIQAKDYIKDAIKIYLKKDEFGDYKIPVERQRPIFLVGAPGIGKTAIMEQIAEELSIALVSYSMTHHTRQSALGLPVISQKIYDGKEYNVTEYTMSEIVSAIYDTISESGIKEGILFLDEINCVSETLAPSMLQFLQYKVFGKHKIPEGFIVVTAGNPPEYNKSVREFDVVTLDRLKVINVDADYDAWRKYATNKGIHSAITAFLDTHNEYFYSINTTIKGRSYVTARGWEDLSEIIKLYEEENFKVDTELILQYIRNDNIAREFGVYYELFIKYKREYDIEQLLDGNRLDEACEKAKKAAWDEQLSLVGMLIGNIRTQVSDAIVFYDFLSKLTECLKEIKQSEDIRQTIDEKEKETLKIIQAKERANSLARDEKKILKQIVCFFGDARNSINQKIKEAADDEFSIIKELYELKVEEMRENTCLINKKLDNLFIFVEKAFNDDNHLLILVNELTANIYTSRYISLFGCDSYYEYQDKLMISERKNSINERLIKLEMR